MNSLRILVIGAGVGGISIARGLLRDGHDVDRFRTAAGRNGGWRCCDHLVQRRDSAAAAGCGYDRCRSAAVHRASRVVHGPPAREFRRGRACQPARCTRSDGAASNSAPAAARRFPCRSHPMRLSRSRSSQHAQRSAGRIRRRHLRRRGSFDRCRWSALDGSRRPRRATCGADRLVQLAGTGHPSRRRRQACRAHHRRRARKRWPLARWRIRSAVVVRHAMVERLRQAAAADRDDPVQLHRMDRFDRSIAGYLDRRRPGPFAVPAFSASDSPRVGSRTADVARRRRTHDAADARAGHQSGATRHHGVVQSSFGLRDTHQPQ